MTRRSKAGEASGRAGLSFRRGFRNRNPLVLVAALLVLVPLVMGVQAFFSDGVWTHIPLKYWLVKASDDYTWVAWTVTNNKAHPADLPSVYLLGGSAAREAIVTGQSLAADVHKLGGPRIVAYNLGSMNQNFAQSIAIIDNIPDTPTTVLVGINPGRFTADHGDNQTQAEGRPIILGSAFLRDYVRRTSGKAKYRYNYTIIPGIFTYLTTYLEDHREELLSFEIPTRRYGHHRYSMKTRRSLKNKQHLVKAWNARRGPVFRKNVAYNLAMLEQLLIEADRRGINVALVELPYNSDVIGHAWDWVYATYRPKVKELAAQYGVPYIDFNLELPLTNNDFQDLDHLVGPGRAIWQRRLAEELVPLLKNAHGSDTSQTAAARTGSATATGG